MSKVTIVDPAEHRTNVPVGDDGRVSIGRDHAGERVNVVVEVVEDAADE